MRSTLLTLLVSCALVLSGCPSAGPAVRPSGTKTPEVEQKKLQSGALAMVCRWKMPVPPERPVLGLKLLGTSQAVQQVRRVRSPTAEHPLRVAHYGDSHSLGGIFARTLSRLWSSDFPVSPGFVTPGHPYFWSAKVERGEGWERQNWLWKQDTGPFGPMGLAFIPREPGATMTLEITDKAAPEEGIEVDALYAGYPNHAPFELVSGEDRLAFVDGEPGDGDGVPLRVETVTLPPGSKSLTLHVPGVENGTPAPFRFFGFVVRYPGSAMEWNSMGVGGTRAYHPHRRGDETFDQYLQLFPPDLLVVWYGTNTGVAKELDEASYTRSFDGLLSRLRASAPDAGCVVVGPPDMMRRSKSCFLSKSERRCLGKRSGRCRKLLRRGREARTCRPDDLASMRHGRKTYPVPGVKSEEGWEEYKETCAFETPEALKTVVRVQRKVALKHECLYFDTFENMGGSGSVWKWACELDPLLARDDLIHLTNDGYALVAKTVYEAIQYVLNREPCED